jgi:hydroxymethylbilane synthase
VNTRLDKLDRGEFDALLLACAGLDRLGLASRIGERLDVSLSLPAAGQGALGVECVAGRADLLALLAPLADDAVNRCVAAERGVSAALGGDCTLPLAAYATIDGEAIRLSALLASVDGRRVLRAEGRGSDPGRVSRLVADELRSAGADDILDALRGRD